MRSAILAVSLLAAAAGGFAFMHETVDVEDAPRRLGAADLDGDVAVACEAAGNVALLFNTSSEEPAAHVFGFAERA